jgi:hypothetical protein
VRQQIGAQPIASASLASLTAVFASLADTDSDPGIRFAGRMLRSRFRGQAPAAWPPE